MDIFLDRELSPRDLRALVAAIFEVSLEEIAVISCWEEMPEQESSMIIVRRAPGGEFPTFIEIHPQSPGITGEWTEQGLARELASRLDGRALIYAMGRHPYEALLVTSSSYTMVELDVDELDQHGRPKIAPRGAP